MFAQCPQCQTIFRVSDEQLSAAYGQVRCGQCLNIFDAREHSREDLRTRNTPHNVAPEPDSGHEEAWLDDEPLFEHEPLFTEEPDVTKKPEVNSEPEHETPSTNQESQIPTVILQDLEDARSARARRSNLPWLLGSMLLILGLAIQAAYFHRDQLAQNPQWRPWLAKVCAQLGCRLANGHDLANIQLLELDIHSHPEVAGALEANSVLINNADFTQAYPLLTLTFSEITGGRVAQRRFTPEEYLQDTQAPLRGMPPKIPVAINLEILDPGQEAVNFEFQLLRDPRHQFRQFN